MPGASGRLGVGRVAMLRAVTDESQSEPAGGQYQSWLPRLTKRVMTDLTLWMTAFGLLIGLLFPFVVTWLGVPGDIALRPVFFLATLTARTLLVAPFVNVVARPAGRAPGAEARV